MILSWRLSNTMDVNFCIDCLRDAFESYGEPEYYNSDQGVQFTSQQFQNYSLVAQQKLAWMAMSVGLTMFILSVFGGR
jgi:hypothetical protein